MNLLEKPLQALTARDLMSQDVLTIPVSMSLRGAAQLLLRACVSGAPVIDGTGRCVGVISTSDFLKLAGDTLLQGPLDEMASCDWQMFELDDVPEDCVQKFMTQDPVLVHPELRLGELVRRMLDAHIHRVIVVDEEVHPVGVVSTTDVLAAVAHYTTTDLLAS